MPFYTGKSRDGSDMEEVEGMYVNPNNPDEWSSVPYPEQAKLIRIKNEVLEYMNGRFTLNDVYKQIKEKKSGLSARYKKFVLSHYDENGNFIEQLD